ncbi:Gfo/Idh/MocA family protein [Agromyces archimandritae]|uniref:Gfo/Idh/MocA family oxidoreductase n=1 Tax=Agromyces archimandritae TaxID=2781962 RepID=A0A975IP90_9MICO|nr:Gfo/Idh/MocA family oxidoreductase [Agromyces archimandritae]QTX05407.1 Gfo/Idh/MocA family oxidoreductase [Agromyces archimandritae]
MTRLRWGILATGGIAHAFTSDLIANAFTVQAVGSRREHAARAFAEEFGIPNAHGSYEELVADPEVDIVYVATPHPFHAENARLALEHGKHVLVEKPFALNAAQAESVARLAAERGLLAMEAMWTRYLPHMNRIREIIAAGTLGEIRSVHADHTQDLPEDPAHRLNAPELGGGALLDLGIYPISFTWDVLGAPATIDARATFKDTGVDAGVATVFGYADPAQIATTFSASDTAGPNRAVILGTEARIEIEAVWYTPTSFRVIASDGTVLEDYSSVVNGRGMHFQAAAAERYVAAGMTSSDILPIEQTVQIMATLDDIRGRIGLRYPDEGA